MKKGEAHMEETKGLQAVVAGHICLDLTPNFNKNGKYELKDIFMPGKLINMGRVNVSTGGVVSNTGLALCKLGINTKLMGKIGADYFGEGILRILKPWNAHTGMIVVDGEETSYTVVIAPPGFDRIFLHNPGANDTFCADDIDYNIVGESKLFHFGYPPLMKRMYENEGKELITILKRVKELGVTTSLDMSLPDASSDSGKVKWDDILKNLLPYVDIFVPSIEETLFMLKREEYNRLNECAKGGDILESLDLNILQELGEKIISYGAKIVVIKCGIKGYYLRTAAKEILASMGKAAPADPDNWSERELHEESFYVSNVVSATGAGDASIAGFLAALLNGRSIEESIRIACSVGAQNVQAPDAISGIKTWDETVDALKKEWRKNRISMEGSYWKYDKANNIWIGGKDKGR